MALSRLSQLLRVSRWTAMPRSAESQPVTRVVIDRRMWLGFVLSELAFISMAGWVAILNGLDARDIDDRGLISVVPPMAFACLALLSLSFAFALRVRPLLAPVIIVHIVALVVMLYGAPAFFEEMPRFVTAWLHVGFSDAIARTGELYPFRDARFDWPGFFVLGAFLSSTANIDSLLVILPWIPPILTLLYLGPLYLIVRSVTADVRLVWLSLWFFCLMNWVGQDYLSPQGFNVLLFLTVIAVLLKWFRRPAGVAAWPHWVRAKFRGVRGGQELAVAADTVAVSRQEALGRISNRQQVGLIAIIALVFGASVASHQLTPFALLGGVVMLVILAKVRLSGLPLLMFVLLSSWLMFRASTFLAGHLAGLLEDVGRPDQFAASNVANRLIGSPGHVLAVQARLGFTAAIWLLALIGGLRAVWARRVDLGLVALAVSPFGLMLLQGYGGEMLLRIFLFSVPFMAYHAATAFFPTPHRGSWLVTGSIVVVSVALAGGLLLTRYGNEKADLVTTLDFDAVNHVIALAEPGDLIAVVNNSVPLGYAEWEQHRSISFEREFLDAEFDVIIDELDERTREGLDAFFVVTRGQRAHAELFWGMDDSSWDARMSVLEQGLELVYENDDATVYVLKTDAP